LNNNETLHTIIAGKEIKTMAKDNLLQELTVDIRSSLLLPGLSAGVVIGLMVIVLQVSFASMIFSGPLSVHVSKGIGMMLAGSLIMILTASLFSGIRSIIAISQDAPVALFAGAAALISVGSDNPESPETFITITAGLILTTFVTGIFFYLIGRFRLADLFRFMPYPVTSGFLAGAGWLLTRGSLEVMTGLPLDLDSFPILFSSELLILWLPGLFYALTLFFVLHRFSNFLILPGSLFAAVLLYYLVLWISGISVPEAQNMGMLYRPFTETALWPAYQPGQFIDVKWNLIIKQMPTLAVIPFISLIGLLLNTGGIELAVKKECDMNKELKINGAANFLAGFFGTSPGYSTLSFSLLGMRTGANTRLVGFIVSLLVGTTLLLGSSILVLFPKAILGGFLLLLGLFFIYDWLIDTAKKMPRSDHILILLIFIVISVFGYLQGVLFGLLMTMLFFIARFSKVPLIESQSDLAQQRSSRIRSLPQQALLIKHGTKTQIYNLSGYIFFGSVNSLINIITESARRQDSTAPAVIILDFTNVNGYDISSVNNFIRLINRFAGQDVHFVFSAPPDGFRKLLLHHLDSDSSGQISFMAGQEKALQWAEDRIIERESKLIDNLSTAGRRARDELFESASDEMLIALERQARVEKLIDSCSPYLVEQNFSKDSLLLEQGKPAEGLYLVKSGVIAEQIEAGTESPTLLRELGPGSTFVEPAAYNSYRCVYSYRAKTAAQVCILDPAALTRLEQDLPRTALELHRLVIDRLLL
jgi:sulfate permease, SulP family